MCTWFFMGGQEYRNYWVLTEAIPVFEGDKRTLRLARPGHYPQRALALFSGSVKTHLGHCIPFHTPHYPKKWRQTGLSSKANGRHDEEAERIIL